MAVVYLTDSSSPVEDRLLERWIVQHTKEPYEAVCIPSSRRQRRHCGDRHRLEELLAEDHTFVPLRVAWLAPEHDGRRSVRFADLFRPGDPRDPGTIIQLLILRLYPDRCRIIEAESASAADLREAWERSVPDSELVDFVQRRAFLALERAERSLRGNRYKVPRFVRKEILNTKAFADGVRRIADEEHIPYEVALRRAARYLKEIAATHDPRFIDLVANGIEKLYRRGYREIIYSRSRLHELLDLGQQHPLVFLPSHKSNLDHLVLQFILWENDAPPNHTAGGINMNFFPVGPIVRRTGVFFIRRSFKDNELYKFVLQSYLDYLIENRFSLEWYLEGGRSRSGKLLPPRYGMLTYVADAYRREKADEVFMLPISITYDQIFDVESYAAEQRGLKKQQESFGWFLSSVRQFRRRFGNIHIRFGEPVALSEHIAQHQPLGRLEVKKLAFEIATRINRATPITPVALVTAALLSAEDRAFSIAELAEEIGEMCRYVTARHLPVTEPVGSKNHDELRVILDTLRDNGIVTAYDEGPETVYLIRTEERLQAAYYRNSIIHFFQNSAIAELALVGTAEVGGGLDVFWKEVAGLRDLLKFEFFFPDRERFIDEVGDELALTDTGWERAVEDGTDRIRALLRAKYPLTAHWVLRPFLDAYQIVADALTAHSPYVEVDKKRFLDECLALGRQYRLQQRISTEESISQVLFSSALALAENRGLLDIDDPDCGDARRRFATEIRAVRHRIDVIEALNATRRVGF